jgi:hypothetical protein
MLKLIAKRNLKRNKNKKKSKIVNKDYIIKDLLKEEGEEISNLEIGQNNLHILNLCIIKDVPCIDNLIPHFVFKFLEDKDSKVRIISFNKIEINNNILEKSIYFWRKIGSNILESDKISFIFINKPEYINFNTNKFNLHTYEIIERYIIYLNSTKNILGICMIDDEKKKMDIKYNITETNNLEILNYNENMLFLIEKVSENYSFFNPFKINYKNIIDNFDYFTEKKQKLVRYMLEQKLNNLVMILYPFFHKLLSYKILNTNEIYQIRKIIGINSEITSDILRNYLSTNIFNFIKYFNITNKEHDILIGTFMSSIDNSDENELISFINNKINTLLISQYKYCYYTTDINFNNIEEYDSSSSYYTSDEEK